MRDSTAQLSKVGLENVTVKDSPDNFMDTVMRELFNSSLHLAPCYEFEKYVTKITFAVIGRNKFVLKSISLSFSFFAYLLTCGTFTFTLAEQYLQ